jgi:hypothetical protein
MHGYIDPFADRQPAREDEPDDGWDGLAAIVADVVEGRREAPFAAAPDHRVRP